MNSRSRTYVFVSACLLLVALGMMVVPVVAQTNSAPAKAAALTFDTPQAAADALVKAAGEGDQAQLLAIFGPDGKDIVSTADPVQDKNNAEAFAERAKRKMSVKLDISNPNSATLLVGDQEWPLPVPIVKKKGKWSFDAKSGTQEILYRRIGANELDAIQVCRGFVEAQHEYAQSIHDDSGVNQYAQKLISTPGKQDGLYWQDANGTPGGPISEAVAKAIQEGYTVDRKQAFHGYYFKVLKGQGPAAPLGQLDYVIQGAMIGGFALIAAPAEYRVTGVKTFIVSQDGVVYQKDLGPNTLELAKKIELFNPDKTWQPTDDQWPEVAESK